MKISGVSINAPSVLKAEIDLEPLVLCLPTDSKQQKTYRLTFPTRSVHWGVSWGVKEDSMLLVGMLVYGVGNWESIKNDKALSLTSKILPVGNGKPQDKHLQSRAEYLLKVLKERSSTKKDNNKKENNKKKKASSRSSKRGSAKTVVEVENETIDETPAAATTAAASSVKEKTKKTDKRKDKKENKKKSDKTSSSTNVVEGGVVVEDYRQMDEAKFKKCKEKLRPEKKSLQSLQTPDESAPQQEQVDTTKKCLLKIGDHIEKCLDDYKNQQTELDSWRSYLWSFVARFTELTPSKLYRLYRTACRKREIQFEEEDKEIQKLKSNYSNTLHEMGKVIPPDRLELEEARKRALGLDENVSSKKIPKLKKIRIPRKNKNEKSTNLTSKPKNDEKPRYQTDQQNFKKSFSRSDNPDNRYHNKYSYKNPALQNAEQKDDSAKYKTYREWKLSQSQRSTPSDEKPAYNTARDEKPALAETSHYSSSKAASYHSYDPRSKTHMKREHKEREPGEYVSPTYMLNSPSASNSPRYHGDQRFHRKRTSSNNSDHTVNHKKPHRDSETSNSNHSWINKANSGGAT